MYPGWGEAAGLGALQGSQVALPSLALSAPAAFLSSL